jgi:type II secretory pathway pseudopilin PulG
MTRRRRALPVTGDRGASLVELMVTLSIMGAAMTIFVGGMLEALRSTNTTESMAVAQSQLQIAFQRLDKEIRYASWIAEPASAPVHGAWYVELAGLNPTTRQPECKQLRLDIARGVLQYLRWAPGAPPPEGQPGETLASELVADAATRPFQRQTAGSYPYSGSSFAPDFQRLRLRLTTRVAQSTTASDVTFTAMNTSRDTSDSNVCQEGRPAP